MQKQLSSEPHSKFSIIIASFPNQIQYQKLLEIILLVAKLVVKIIFKRCTMKKRIFGFDLGIASIGWAVVDFDKEAFDEETGEVIEGKIIGSGVRCFPVAENPKDGASLALPRRTKRLARRVCRRKARRMQAIKKLFVAQKLAKNIDEIETLYANQKGGDVWDLRIKGLSEKLSQEELLRVLTHLAKHRGFKSYRKAVEENDKEGGRVLQAIRDNKALLSSNKTLAQVIVEKVGQQGKKRNCTKEDAKGKKVAVYNNSIPREEIERELDMIFGVQQQYGIFTKKLYDDFKNIAFRFKPAGSVGDMVGSCTFEKGEKRAPKNAPSSELFVALTKINNMSLNDNGTIRVPTAEERRKIVDLLKTTKSVKYKTLASKVFPKGTFFRDINYNKTEKKTKDGTIQQIDPEDVLFYEMKGWHQLKSKFSADEWADLQKNIPLLDKVVNIIACEKNDEAITKALKGIDSKYISKFVQCSFDKFINLSFKALYKIIPFMENGDVYNKACEKAGYDFKATGETLVEQKGMLLFPISEDKLTTVPVVNRTIAQFRKVYNAMVRKYGLPDQINIETGRELKKTHDERMRIENKNKENQEERKTASVELESRNVKGNATNILKYRLYQEQDGKCIYSGNTIDITRLDEIGYLDIDHIIPYSRSLDNSYNNKVLCLSSENRKKGNMTPYEYLKDSGHWDSFEARVKLLHNKTKENHLLDKNFVDRELEFRERNANDNSHISRYIKQYCEDGIDFSSSPWKNIKNRIQMRTGSLTDYLRHHWGLKKDRNESDKHHAQDAIVIACATQEMVGYLSYVSKIFENKYEVKEKKGEIWYKTLKKRFEEPWTGFREDVLASLDKIFVSRPPRKSATGEIHQATIYPLNPKHKNYDAKNVKSGMLVRGGIAGNGNMLRTDVFVKKNKKGKDEFYLVPIYLSDMGHELPNKAIVAYKDEKDWINMDDTYTFKFSLFLDDLVKVTKSTKEIFGYFKGTGRTTGSITIEAPDRSSVTPSIGVKTQDKIQKFTVDPLGNITEIKQETRVPLTNIKSNKQRLADRKAKREQRS